MYSTQELQKILGLSRRQLRARLDTLARAGLLEGQEKRGPRNRKEFAAGVLEMLRELDALYRLGGQQLATCAEELAERIRGNGQEQANSDGQVEGHWAQLAGQPPPVVEALREALADARTERDHWRALAEAFHRELTELRIVELAPPRRRWWARVLGR